LIISDDFNHSTIIKCVVDLEKLRKRKETALNIEHVFFRGMGICRIIRKVLEDLGLLLIGLCLDC